jgi:hypothetical protein
MSFQEHLYLIHNRDKARYKSAWYDFLADKDSELDITYRMSTRDKSWLWFRDVGKVVQTDKSGKPLLALALTQILLKVLQIKKTCIYWERLQTYFRLGRHT